MTIDIDIEAALGCSVSVSRATAFAVMVQMDQLRYGGLASRLGDIKAVLTSGRVGDPFLASCWPAEAVTVHPWLHATGECVNGCTGNARNKLNPLPRLRCRTSIADAVVDLGGPVEIGQVFASFQKYLYQASA
jgi:hypothetical protein